ncbi:MAG: TonB-dependent receptor, partial [Bacteroidota bacterium]
DLAPLIDYPATGNTINASSNPYLAPALAYNYDIGGSVFSNDVGLLSADFYYKKLTGLPVSMPGYEPSAPERALIYGAPAGFVASLPPLSYFTQASGTMTCSIPINNPENAYARGIELSWQTHLWYLPGVLSGLVLDLNASFMSSNALYPYFNNNLIAADSAVHHGITSYTYYNVYQTRKGTLLNMPDATYNIIVGWDYLGFSIRYSLRYQRTTLTGLDSRYSIADQYYDNFLLSDIMAKQKLTDHLSIFANFTNIGKEIDSYYENTLVGALPTSMQTYGFNAQFGASYVF